MALGRDQDTATSLPDLKAGDRLEVSAELEVTTDLTTAELQANKGKGCYSKPYDYPPKVTAALVLATAKGRRTPAPGTAVIATKTAAVEHEAHHFVFVFNRVAIKVPSNWKGRGAVNLVLRANAARARPGHCLLVGANEPDGTVQTRHGRYQRRSHPRPADQPRGDPRNYAPSPGARHSRRATAARRLLDASRRAAGQ